MSFSDKKNILILGGTGAIGVELVHLLSETNKYMIDVTSRKSRTSDKWNICYVQGNAHDNTFISDLLLQKSYDVIVDFMIYKTDEFRNRYELLLSKTDQYVFLSSGRVYANSNKKISEKSLRLLDICEDNEYLKTDEYALSKARQEDILRSSGSQNWTILRPYITYNDERLQLGILEKENWLYRALRNHTIIFSSDIAQKITTMTYGGDVAKGISSIIGEKKAYGETFQILQPEPIEWQSVLEIYLKVLKSKTGVCPKVIMLDDSKTMIKYSGGKYQAIYDRMYDRTFDNFKILQFCPELKDSVRTPEGLEKCLSSFLDSDRLFKNINWKFEGFADKIANENYSLKEIIGFKNKLRYLLARYTKIYELLYK